MNRWEGALVRRGSVDRKTLETDISVTLDLDGRGQAQVCTGIGFFDHMLTAFAKHSGFDLTVTAAGDLEVDGHHTVEDVGISLGQALRQAVHAGKGIARFGEATVPMDEALVQAVLDISGRAYLAWDVPYRAPMIGDFDTQLTVEFFRAFVHNAAITLHVRKLAGENDHHIVEAAFKAVARALGAACRRTGSDEVLSTKGSLQG
ncbi:MAG: imidazoleglycerol-phosphate dehydratase HisB [Firmicutes bacterium]|nr:imidazoleglycerol-phosphate dehydratase HisB [Bacillota bacterium]